MRKVIIDCDPGHDDAFAIILAAKNLELLGVTTVGGNGYLEDVTRNALQVLDVIGRPDVKVYPGCAGPSTVSLVTAPNCHGKSAMDGPKLAPPSKEPETTHGVDYIIDTVMSTDDVTIIATAPLTNIAAAINKEPRIVGRVRELSIMGGGAYCGNWTPAAEFNIWVDAEASYRVFHSGIPIKMSGVNLTRQCLVTPKDREALRAVGNKTGVFAAELLDYFGNGGSARLHDACAVAWLIDDSIVTAKKLHVDIELNGTLTRGMTVCDLRPLQTEIPDADLDLNSPHRWDEEPVGSPFRGQKPNAEVGLRFDMDKFRTLLMKTVKSCD
ncbi:MAG: nucleoside hydrolase [Oscillospiraceae bacterium]|nr:nucleoside hydrolase [Oscillospiraceae bacterium]